MTKILNAKRFGAGQPLVILHGLFGMLDNWQGLAKEFGQFFETHILDQRNQGK
jgi:esterase